MNRDQLALYQPLRVFDEAIFENIVDDLVTSGFSIQRMGYLVLLHKRFLLASVQFLKLNIKRLVLAEQKIIIKLTK